MTERDFFYNEELLHFFNGLVQKDGGSLFVLIFADLPTFLMPLFLVGWWLWYTFGKSKITISEKQQQKSNLLIIFYTSVIGIIGNIGIQQLFHFQRPEQYCQVHGILVFKHIPDASFPSDHAAMSFAFLVAIYLAGYKKTAALFTIIFTSMAVARVMACVHWPYDILAGAIFGTAFGALVFHGLQRSTCIKKCNNICIQIASKCKL